MRKAVFSLMLVMACGTAFSQEAPGARMIPGQRGLFFKRHAIEFRALYGKWTAPDVVDAIGQSVFEGANIGNALGSFDVTGGGVYGGTILLFPDNKISIGADFLVNANVSTVKTITNGGGADFKYDMKYTSIMGRIDVHYINFHHFKLYGSGAIGASWRSATSGSDEAKKTGLAYQFTPIGVAVGGMIVGWAELGFGYRGVLSAGVALRF